MAHVLRQLVQHQPHRILRLQIAHAGCAVAHGLDRRHKFRGHDRRMIRAVGKAPEHDAVLSQTASNQLGIGLGQIADGHDVHAHQPTRSGRADIEQLRNRQRPDLFLKIGPADYRHRVRLFHIRPQLGEYLAERHANGHRQSNFFPDALADFLGNHPAFPFHIAAPVGNRQPVFIHAKGLNVIRIPGVNAPHQLRILQIQLVMRRHTDQPRTALPRLPIRRARFHAHALGRIRGRQHNAVPILRRAAHSNGLAAQIRIFVHLHAGIKAIQVAMQNHLTGHCESPLGFGYHFSVERSLRRA